MTITKAIFLTICSIQILIISAIVTAEPIRTLVGNARDLKTHAFVYTEDHIFDDDPANTLMSTRYLDPNDALIGERLVNFNQGRVLGYEFKQTQLGISKSVVRATSQINYVTTQKGKTTRKNYNPEPDEDILINAGLFNLVEREWSTLSAGEKVKFELAIPPPASRRTINMVVQATEYSSSPAAEFMPNENLATFLMVVSNRLLRFLVEPIHLGYYKDTKQLAFYQGPSNLQNEKGEAMKPVYILYERSEQP